MKLVPLFVAIFASLPLLAAAVPTQQYDLEIPSEDLTAFVAEDDQAGLVCSILSYTFCSFICIPINCFGRCKPRTNFYHIITTYYYY
jgi:hypothetical protein